MAKKHKNKLKQVDTAEKEPTARKRKGRATRREMIEQHKKTLAKTIKEFEDLGIDEDTYNEMSLIKSIRDQIATLEKNEAEQAGKKDATIFQDVVREMKAFKDAHPQVDAETLRDTCLVALNKFKNKLASKEE